MSVRAVQTPLGCSGKPRWHAGAAMLVALVSMTACGHALDPQGEARIGVVKLVEAPKGVASAGEGWGMMESAALAEGGDAISRPGYAATWYPVTLPTTVLAGLSANGVFTDLYRGSTLDTVSPDRVSGSWWYRMEFVAPESFRSQNVFLHLDRINYRANVWLDGKQIASSAEVAGTFRMHELDVSAVLMAGAPNALAIEVFPPDLGRDLAISWVDWNPPAPDDNTGILGEVYFTASGPVTLRFPQISSALQLPSLASAALTVRAEIANNGDQPVTATVSGTIEAATFSQEIPLAPREVREVLFTPADFPQLILQNPRVWWPAQMGAQELYQLSLVAAVSQQPSSLAALRFGIRTVTSELTGAGHLLFRVNGKPILIRGAGWSPDLLLRSDARRLEAEIAYVKNLGLNAIRLEGHLESDRFFELCDEQGILVIAGWQCCDAWQDWDHWGPEQLAIAKGSMADQAKRLRSHPSVIDFLIGSDAAPPPQVEEMFVGSLLENHWPNPISASAAATDTPLLGPSGLKMTGPYQWVSPSYWYLDTEGGGAFGFNTETGPGTAIPKVPSLKNMLDDGELATLLSDNPVAQYHAGYGRDYADLGIFNQALNARYGRAADLEDYVLKAQLMQYESERALFEAFGRNKSAEATGVIHWKLNSAWPSLIWNLYDSDLVPAGAYFGAKKGNETLHIQYSYDDRSIVVVNHGPQAVKGLLARVAVHDFDGAERFSAQVAVDVSEDGVQPVLVLPDIPDLSTTWFVKLSLDDASGQRVSDNFYWLSTSPEIIDWSSNRWYALSTLSFSDFTSLRQLPLTSVAAVGVDERGPDRGEVRVQLTNTSATVALFLQLELARGDTGPEVAPVLWQDNDITLMPGETRTVAVSYQVEDLAGADPAVRFTGWNVPRTSIPLVSNFVGSTP